MIAYRAQTTLKAGWMLMCEKHMRQARANGAIPNGTIERLNLRAVRYECCALLEEAMQKSPGRVVYGVDPAAPDSDQTVYVRLRTVDGGVVADFGGVVLNSGDTLVHEATYTVTDHGEAITAKENKAMIKRAKRKIIEHVAGDV